MSRVLLAYETTHGSTLHTAGEMAETVRRAKHQAEVRQARRVGDLATYDAVILGAPIQDGEWHGDAVRFVGRHREILGTMPFRVFALGPRIPDRPHESYADECERVRQALELVGCPSNARVAIFGGLVDASKLHFPFSRFEPGDWRPWPAIDAWVAELVRELPRSS